MTGSLQEKAKQLYTIADEVASCTACPLHAEGRQRTVPGAGPANAEIMFIGEAPGAREDEQGIPFVGRSGQYLNQLLEMVGLSRRDVFIANVVKCRPPNNRDPLPEELTACKTYLDRQIAIINPKAIVTLGRISMNRYFPDGRITKIHGQPKYADGRIYYPMFHPAYVLRNGNMRPDMEADMRKLIDLIAALGDTTRPQDHSEQPYESPPRDEPGDGTPKQLSLF